MKKKPIKSVTIFCSSSNLVDKKYKKLAFNLGKYLASNSINLVYGGGSNGLMGEIARSTKLYGGYVVGVIPKFLSTKENIKKRYLIQKRSSFYYFTWRARNIRRNV